MAKRKYNITPDLITRVRELYSEVDDNGKKVWSQSKLGKHVGLPKIYITAFVNGFESYTEYQKHRIKENGFESYQGYRNHLAKERGFESLTEYLKHRIKEAGFESRTEYQKHRIKENGFESLTEYQKHLAKEKGFESRHEYQKHLAKEAGFKSLTEYKKHLAKENGFESLYEYEKHRAKENGKLEQFLLKDRLSSNLYQNLKQFTKEGKTFSSSKYGIDYSAIISSLEKEAEEVHGKNIGQLMEEGYHVDHIIPVSNYNLEDPEEVGRCYHPDNLRWLPGEENKSRGNKFRDEDLEVILSVPNKVYPKKLEVVENAFSTLNYFIQKAA